MNTIWDTQRRVATHLAALPWPLVGLLALTLVGVKTLVGANRELTELFWIPAALALPRATEYYSSSLGLPSLARIFGIDDVDSWVILGLLIFLLSLIFSIIAAGTIYRTNPGQRVLMILVIAFLPLTTVAATELDRGTGLMLFGTVLLALGKRWVSVGAGTILMILAHPEHALIASTSLLLISLSQPMSSLRNRAMVSLTISATAFIFVQVWMLSSGVVSSRLVLLGSSLAGSLITNSGQWTWLVYAYGGMLWGVLAAAGFWLFKSSSSRGRLAALFGLFVIPFLATFVTADGVRVLAPVSALGILVIIRIWLEQIDESLDRNTMQLIGGTLLWALVLPPVSNNWEVGSKWLVVPVAEGIERLAEPLKEWMLDRFPTGQLPADGP